KTTYRIPRGGLPRESRRGAALQTDGVVVHQNIAQVPVKAQRASVALRNLDEFGFDVYLRRRDIQDLHRLLDNVQVLQRRPDEQGACAVVEKDALAGIGQHHAQRGEEVAHQQVHGLLQVGARYVSDAGAPGSAATQTATAAANSTGAAAAKAAPSQQHPRDSQ